MWSEEEKAYFALVHATVISLAQDISLLRTHALGTSVSCTADSLKLRTAYAAVLAQQTRESAQNEAQQVLDLR